MGRLQACAPCTEEKGGIYESGCPELPDSSCFVTEYYIEGRSKPRASTKGAWGDMPEVLSGAMSDFMLEVELLSSQIGTNDITNTC